jgi:hypothetical protein
MNQITSKDLSQAKTSKKIARKRHSATHSQ